mmetsp:Transcript_18300/g.30003  ORF Transcript_18300/g.30003 Transcript_18300/m.30003 type:complete len:112 (+) Transcript_18300:814-1149(+)
MVYGLSIPLRNKFIRDQTSGRRLKCRSSTQLFSQIGNTCLKHSQNLNNATSNNHKHEEGDKTFAYRWIIGVFCRLANGNMPTFIDVAIEFLLSIANVSWCWHFLLFYMTTK